LATDSAAPAGPNLIKAFRNEGVIDAATFSFYLVDTDNASYIDIGYVRDDAMKDPTNLIMIDILTDNYWWAQSVTAIRFGEDDANMFELHGEEGFTDSGTSCLIVPSRYYEWFYDRMRYDYNMSYTSNNMSSVYLDVCDDETIAALPTLWILFGGHWF
jgi:hypothetical protein